MGKRGSAIKELSTPVVSERSHKMAAEFYHQINDFHAMGLKTDPNVEIEFYSNVLHNLRNPVERTYIPKDAYIFMPSSASKCKRELYLHLTGNKKNADEDRLPYHHRWVRNSTAVHEAVQKDFLYMRKYMPESNFQIHLVDGIPMWEENLKTTTLVDHKGVQFALVGQMDGILRYVPENKLIGFEFKTKTNSVAQVGTYKMKDIADSHKLQAVCYKIMFGLDEFIFMYEAVAKDQWFKGKEARMDIRVFYIEVTDQMVEEMKDKFYDVIKAIEAKEVPDKELDKCMLCDYKTICGGL